MRVASAIRIGLLVTGTCACLGIPARTQAQAPEDYFRQNCSMCHTVGGGHLIGPDLEGVTKRKDRAWLIKFVQDPKAMIDSKDPYAAQILQDAHGLAMPTVPGMTRELASSLLDYIEGKPSAAKAEAPGAAVADRPFTEADTAMGRQLFLGAQPLANGGPSCVSCHTLGTIGGLGGGRLGPDLTQVYDRLGGRRGVGAWLSSPPTPTMQSLFRKRTLQPEEIFSLLAAIDDASQRSQPAGASSIWKFFLVGLGGMLAGLILLQLAWRGRFRAVRQLMVRGQIRGAQ
jgi:cytochrome c2